MSGPRAGGKESDRERIRACVLDRVGKVGFLSTDIEEVLERTGLDPAEFARHYESMAACVTEIWEEIDAELEAVMAAGFGDGDGRWEDRLRASLRAGLGYLSANQGRARFYVVEGLFVNEAVRDLQRETIARLSRLIDLGREVQPGAEAAPVYIADAVAGAILHRVHHLVRVGAAAELPTQLPLLMYFAVMPFRGLAAAEAELRAP